MTLLIILLLCVILSALGAYLEDKYYVDKNGNILFYYDNDYDYHWRDHK